MTTELKLKKHRYEQSYFSGMIDDMEKYLWIWEKQHTVDCLRASHSNLSNHNFSHEKNVYENLKLI